MAMVEGTLGTYRETCSSMYQLEKNEDQQMLIIKCLVVRQRRKNCGCNKLIDVNTTRQHNLAMQYVSANEVQKVMNMVIGMRGHDMH